MNLIRICLDREPGAAPDPLRLAVEIDGRELHGLVGVSLVARRGDLARVVLAIDARVVVDLHGLVEVSPDPLDGLPPSSDTRLILAAIERLNDTMTDLTQAEVDEAAAVTAVIAELQKLSGELTQVSAQLQAALADNDPAAAKAAADQLEASAAKLNLAVAAVTATDPLNPPASPPPPPPPPPASPPTISPASISGTAGQALSGQFTLSPAPDGPITWTASDVPPDFSIASDGTISGTPAAAEAGDLKVDATDASGALLAEAIVPYTISAAASA